jgi:hypothetical protein
MDVQGFDSLDEMFAAMAASEDIANLRITPGQARLRDATTETVYWAQAVPEYDLVIYGKTPPNAETQKGAGFDVDDNRERGYLTGIAYSADLEDGEPGDTHVSQVIPISLHTFTVAEALDWPRFSALREGDNRILGAALAQHETDSKK